MMRNVRGSTAYGLKHRCWHHSTRAGPLNHNFLSCMQDAGECMKDHLSIPGRLNIPGEARSAQRGRLELLNVVEFCFGY